MPAKIGNCNSPLQKIDGWGIWMYHWQLPDAGCRLKAAGYRISADYQQFPDGATLPGFHPAEIEALRQVADG